MPSDDFSHLGSDELHDLIAVLQSLEPNDRRWPSSEVRAVGRMWFAFGRFPLPAVERIDHERKLQPAPPPEPTARYGVHLMRVGGCFSCHGHDLPGGPMPGLPPGFPPPRNITPHPEVGIGAWTAADFARALRDGLRPDGTEIDPFMPWRSTRYMTDEEIQAVWAHIREAPPLEARHR